MAAEQVFKTGIPVSVSVMFACPWYLEAVEILKRYPSVSVGVHLTLNSEWKNYRWGPVCGRSAVPSLVDSNGFFWPSRALLFTHSPRTDDVERELRAQIERAIHSGLRIDYLDYHMGAAVQTPELRALVERLATEYQVGISRYFGELDMRGVYKVSIEAKTDSLSEQLKQLPSDAIQLLVCHIGVATPEMNALEDMNAFGLSSVGQQRFAELNALVSPKIQQQLRSDLIRMMTYSELVRGGGLNTMKRPAGD
jgi:predicted glycoside hydrolase/deacetylase ChbG (UPF0249 family)